MNSSSKSNMNISTRSFLTAIVVIFVLMIASYVLTLVIPGGSYARVDDGSGHMIVDVAGGFSFTEGGLPFWKWLLSPVLILACIEFYLPQFLHRSNCAVCHIRF